MTPWAVIDAAMRARGIRSEYALVRLLSQASGIASESVRRNLARWKKGAQPQAEWRAHLATVLGGAPADYEGATRAPDEAEIAAEIAALRSGLDAVERQLADLREPRDDAQ